MLRVCHGAVPVHWGCPGTENVGASTFSFRQPVCLSVVLNGNVRRHLNPVELPARPFKFSEQLLLEGPHPAP